MDALRHLREEMEGLQVKLTEQQAASTARLQEAVDEVRAETIAKMRKKYEEEMEEKLGEARKVHKLAVSNEHVSLSLLSHYFCNLLSYCLV